MKLFLMSLVFAFPLDVQASSSWTTQEVKEAEIFCKNVKEKGPTSQLCGLIGQTDSKEWFSNAKIFQLYLETPEETGPIYSPIAYGQQILSFTQEGAA